MSQTRRPDPAARTLATTLLLSAVLAASAVAACGPTAGDGPGDRAAASEPAAAQPTAAPQTPAPAQPTKEAAPTSWFWDPPTGTYVATGTPPACPSPLIEAGSLLDVSGVKSKLVPGQVRDGEYLVNGTFRWSGPDDPFPQVTVTMPFDGYVTGSWQFLKAGSYLFGLNLVHPCGLMLRLSKMHDPSPEVKAAILDALGTPRERDSRETFTTPGVWLEAGTVLALSVGVPPPNTQTDVVGAQLDVAILDLRTRNPQIPDDFDFARWSGSASPQYVFYARCFYEGDYLADEDRALIVGLPLGGGSPTSDTCVGA